VQFAEVSYRSFVFFRFWALFLESLEFSRLPSCSEGVAHAPLSPPHTVEGSNLAHCPGPPPLETTKDLPCLSPLLPPITFLLVVWSPNKLFFFHPYIFSLFFHAWSFINASRRLQPYPSQSFPVFYPPSPSLLLPRGQRTFSRKNRPFL